MPLVVDEWVHQKRPFVKVGMEAPGFSHGEELPL